MSRFIFLAQPQNSSLLLIYRYGDQGRGLGTGAHHRPVCKLNPLLSRAAPSHWKALRSLTRGLDTKATKVGKGHKGVRPLILGAYLNRSSF